MTVFSSTTQSLSLAEARRVALAAQGLATQPKPTKRLKTERIGDLFQRLNLLQIDSVNVFERSHYMPVFARLGQYDKAKLDEHTLRQHPEYTEYWAHEAAIIPMRLRPLFQWRMDDFRQRHYAREDAWARHNEDMLDWLRAELAEKGPMRASEVEHDRAQRTGSWWGWSDVKRGLEYLFEWGEVASAGRQGFERMYALASDVVPSEVLNQTVPADDAVRELVRRSVTALGVGTAADVADYFRLKRPQAQRALDELSEAGEVERVRVEGWKDVAWMHPATIIPRQARGSALLSPFDPIVWFRPRAERLFDFHYRIEIYTPAEKRVYGYYSLPVLINGELRGRVDLKNFRKEKILSVQSAWTEDETRTDFAPKLATLLEQAAQWQGLDRIVVNDWGNATEALKYELGSRA